MTSGLAWPDTPNGTLIAYATQPGGTASDGVEDNGTYTAELLRQMRIPQHVALMFQRVRERVAARTNEAQVPWENSSLTGSFSFSTQQGSLTSETVAPEVLDEDGALEVVAGRYRLRLDELYEGVTWDASGRVIGLDLRGFRLRGGVPPELSALPHLQTLDLSSNDLTGQIPAAYGELSALSALDLSGNRLTGPVPAELTKLAQLEKLDLSKNGLTGELPAEIAQLKKLSVLDLSTNELAGAIPVGLGQLSSLTTLDLSENRLGGPVPEELTN